MSVRRRINRYRTEPSGYDYNEVLKKSKAFYRSSEYFEIHPIKIGGQIIYSASSKTIGFKIGEGTRMYMFDRKIKRWQEITEQKIK